MFVTVVTPQTTQLVISNIILDLNMQGGGCPSYFCNGCDFTETQLGNLKHNLGTKHAGKE